jgi:hypothetical protein
MRIALACLSLLAVAATPAGGCGWAAPGTTYDPCAGKACGASCTACPPGLPGCHETAVVKACDPSGACTAEGTFACPAPPPVDPCAGKACHDPCDPCPPGATGCVAVLCITWCDGAGRCTCAGGGAACP